MTAQTDLHEELMSPGHLACAGCGAAPAMRYALEALGPRTIVVMPASCWSIICGPFPHSALRVPTFHTAFETGAVAASGIRASLEVQGKHDVNVMAWAGDGGTFDIGIQALSATAERNDDIIYVCYDNEAYMNTGIQRSSATPAGAWTTTTPGAKLQPKKNMMAIMAAHSIPYAATASIAFPDDFIRKMKKAGKIPGTRFFHVLASCPTGWRIPSSLSVKIARLAVHTNVFPLYEIEDGERYTITVRSRNLPVRDYLVPQGRFRNLTDEKIAQIQQAVDRNWARLNRLGAENAGRSVAIKADTSAVV
jgi:pyruvate/2-oxoacid:ferredoxin oxidoreductase beta subunit